MPQENAIPPQPVAITIYVPPAVRKYVMVRLGDPEQLYFDERSKRLWEELEKSLRGRKLVKVELEPVRDDRPRQSLVLHVLPNAGGNTTVSYYLHRYVASTLFGAFKEEMRLWVKWYHQHLGMERLTALEHFRRRYGISEEDHRLDTAYRLLHKQRRPKRRRRRKVAR